ncbi:MAG: FAD-binding oxidoreductase [Alphaproteobacteria bacterium]|nr:FAD-binding oxidoreductase [Alphaproteobacteria bacterium]
MAKKIIVIGAGVIGASVAYHLAAQGASVLVLEAQAIMGGLATPNSWAWINASWGNPDAYVKLRLESIRQWRVLSAVHPQLQVNWCGGLLWDLPVAELTKFAKHHASLGYRVGLVDGAKAKQLEPALQDTPAIAAHALDEGMIEPADAVAGFAAKAKELGAVFITDQHASRLVTKGARVVGVETRNRILQADDVVIAAGAATNTLLSTINLALDMDAPAGLLVHTQVTKKFLHGLVMAPEIHVRQSAEGRLILGTDFAGTQPGADPAAAAAVILAKLKILIAGTQDLEMEFFTVGYRPTPTDGFPAIGRLDGIVGLYVAVTHSGITLAPAVGSMAAQDILSGDRHALLGPYDPDRLLV